MTTKKTIRILSIDGGGILGIIPLHVLSFIEKHTKQHTSHLFDCIGGTSSGGIIALALSCPDAKKNPLYTAENTLDLFQKKSHTIFQKSFFHTLTSWIPFLNRIYTIFFPKYTDVGGKSVFKSLFEDKTLSQSLCPTFISTYALSKPNPRLFIFNSTKVAQEMVNGGPDFLIRDIALATSAAPTFFPPKYVKYVQKKDKKEKIPHPFVDGAVAMNNMSLFLYAHARKKYPGHPIHILSLGIRQKCPNVENICPKRMGLMSWLKKASCFISHPQSSSHQSVLKKLISESNQNDVYERIQSPYGSSLKEFDNTSAEHIKEIIKIAEKTVSINKKKICAFFQQEKKE